MRPILKYAALTIAAPLAFALAFLGFDRFYGEARADAAGGQLVVDAGSVAALDAGIPVPPPETAVVTDTGSGSGVVVPVPVPLPSSQLADPTSNPAGTISDFQAAKHYGWGAVVALALIVLCRVLGKLGGIFKSLATGRIAAVVAGVLAVATSTFDALAMGGSWVTAGLAAIVAFAAYWDSRAKPKADAQ